jgi:hypothetical protein
MRREDRDPFRRLSAKEVPSSARWSASGRHMTEDEARHAQRRAVSIQHSLRAKGKEKDRR